ncbi:hypothetical protein SPF06_21485 [Sinomonas sp. JGH33]|uniref:Integral membrane protein n=1 Tax=Sinomonas terricola TaxID=3110330 RepID=A0ABU5TCF7_9MICC|nr:hypothetical protein [Sinomonas sp. JGH33]MEA5457298.1 hypothetical protein [Sinomonas sp. JGH33]
MRNIGLHLAATLYTAGIALQGRIEGALAPKDKDSERGSITLEQVLWAAGIGLVAVAVIAIVVGVINSKAGQIGRLGS